MDRSLPPATAAPGSVRPAPSPRDRKRWRHATRRRLFVAISTIALAFVAALLFEVLELHRIETRLTQLRLHEEQMRRALELENAVRSQYAHQAHFVVGENAHLAGQRDARERARELARALLEVVDEDDEKHLLAEIEQAGDDLDQIFMNGIAPAVLNQEPVAMLLHDKSYAYVAVIETNADKLFGKLLKVTRELRNEVQALEDATLRWTIVLIATAPLFAAGVAFYIGRSVARPLAQLGEGADRVAGGDLDSRIDIQTPDEFGIVAAQFNAMTAALKDNQRMLVESEKLAGIGRLAAGFAHEINNPLAVLLGLVMRHRRASEGELAKDLDVAQAEIHRCKSIVQELLELARTNAPSATRVDLRQVCDDVLETFRASGLLHVESASVEGYAMALGQGDKLRQVVVNLMKNAIEAAGPAGRVEVRVAEAGPWAEITVRDDGPGVPPEIRERLFEPFFTTKADGTGLGLAVSRSIARAHGGDIEVESSAEGAVFKVRVRSAAAATGAATGGKSR